MGEARIAGLEAQVKVLQALMQGLPTIQTERKGQ
jgi:hypothetical protein